MLEGLIVHLMQYISSSSSRTIIQPEQIGAVT